MVFESLRLRKHQCLPDRSGAFDPPYQAPLEHTPVEVVAGSGTSQPSFYPHQVLACRLQVPTCVLTLEGTCACCPSAYVLVGTTITTPCTGTLVGTQTISRRLPHLCSPPLARKLQPPLSRVESGILGLRNTIKSTQCSDEPPGKKNILIIGAHPTLAHAVSIDRLACTNSNISDSRKSTQMGIN